MATVSTAAKQALANWYNRGTKVLHPRFLIFLDSHGVTPVYTLLTDSAPVTDETVPDVVTTGTCVAPVGVTSPFKTLLLIGDVGANEIADVSEAQALVDAKNAATSDAIDGYVIDTETGLAVVVTAGDRATGVMTDDFS